MTDYKARNDAQQHRPSQADQIKNWQERQNYIKEYEANKKK